MKFAAKTILISIPFLAPVLVFAQTLPNDATSSTAQMSGNVFTEVVSITLYILENYQTPLVGVGIIFTLVMAIFAILKLLGYF